MISYILATLVGLIIIAADQYTKHLVTQNMILGGESVPFIDGFIEFFYIHNEGGAWGFLEGNTWILISITVLAMLVCLTLIVRHGIENKILFWALSLVLAGGIGNLIDRVLRGGKVVDFLNFQFIDFPVFNIADIAVCVGVGLLFLYFILDTIKDRAARKHAHKEDGEV